LGCDVGNQLEALGKTTCTEKRKKCWKKLGWTEKQRRTFADPRGMVEWQWEAGCMEFWEAGVFPNTP
jgi:hypothetical protein